MSDLGEIFFSNFLVFNFSYVHRNYNSAYTYVLGIFQSFTNLQIDECLFIFLGKIPIASLDLALTFWALLRQLKNRKKINALLKINKKKPYKTEFLPPSYIHPVFINYCYVLLHACYVF